MTTTARPPTSTARGGAPAAGPAAAPGAVRDITAIPRAVISAAVGMVHSMERAMGAAPAPTARDNAWAAVCADRARAAQRDELRRAVASLHSVGSPTAARPTDARPAAALPAEARPARGVAA
jgi:hypothetical protein